MRTTRRRRRSVVTTALAIVLAVAAVVVGQQAGKLVQEDSPTISLTRCTSDGSGVTASCAESEARAVLDANWRWVHEVGGYRNCFSGGGWDPVLCPDPHTCAKNCALEGADHAKYSGAHGVEKTSSGALALTLGKDKGGSRLLLARTDGSAYELLFLLNRTLKIDVDVSAVPCGVNAAVYLVGIDKLGDMGQRNNDAGARFGTGYGDAQSPKDLRFVGGVANLQNSIGLSAVEVDVLEANRNAMAWAAHPCRDVGLCHGRICDNRCDTSGATMNSYRQGNTHFYGPGQTLDSERAFTVEMSFREEGGVLSKMTQAYTQAGRRLLFPGSPVLSGSSWIDADSVLAQASAFENKARKEDVPFFIYGGFSSLTASMRKGMVLVLSIWGDPPLGMQWLDGVVGSPPLSAGAVRGPCGAGEEAQRRRPPRLRGGGPQSSPPLPRVLFSNIRLE